MIQYGASFPEECPEISVISGHSAGNYALYCSWHVRPHHVSLCCIQRNFQEIEFFPVFCASLWLQSSWKIPCGGCTHYIPSQVICNFVTNQHYFVLIIIVWIQLLSSTCTILVLWTHKMFAMLSQCIYALHHKQQLLLCVFIYVHFYYRLAAFGMITLLCPKNNQGRDTPVVQQCTAMSSMVSMLFHFSGW